MKIKSYLMIMILLISLIFMAVPAQAQRACWQFDGFSDQMELGYERHTVHYVVHGKWVAGTSYFMPVVGNLSPDGAGWNLGIHMTNNTTAFADFDNCVLDADLNGSLNGPFTVDCGAGGFTASGTISLISCPIAESAADGPAVGE
jgi:hypothetical protein